jgi:N-acetylneuraminic acid mutarotase
LKNGNVLVAGGENGSALAEAEIYDAVQGSWSPASPMSTARSYHSATLLTNGLVLVAGGRNEAFDTVQSAEVYDASTNGWTLTGEMNFPRWSHTATLVPFGGKVLVAGGRQLEAELYDPSSGHWTLTLIGGITNALYGQTATLLPNGRVLVASGIDLGSAFETITNAWIYDPRTDSWSVTADLNQGRYGHTATALPNGCILVAGGGNLVAPFRLANTESFVPVDPIVLTATTLPNAQLQMTFTNTPGFSFNALASTNVSLPLSNWTALGDVTEVSPGHFQFTDSQATNSAQRFYRVRAN